MLSSKRIRPLSKIQPLSNGKTRLHAYALLYKGMLDGIMSLAGFQVTTTFRQNQNSGDYEFILTSVSSVCSQTHKAKETHSLLNAQQLRQNILVVPFSFPQRQQRCHHGERRELLTIGQLHSNVFIQIVICCVDADSNEI